MVNQNTQINIIVDCSLQLVYNNIIVTAIPRLFDQSMEFMEVVPVISAYHSNAPDPTSDMCRVHVYLTHNLVLSIGFLTLIHVCYLRGVGGVKLSKQNW